MTIQHYTNLADVKATNRLAGQHWFDPESMEFFKSKIETELIDGRYFISSEQSPWGPRAYSIRIADENGEIDTVGEFMGHETLKLAKLALATETAV